MVRSEVPAGAHVDPTQLAEEARRWAQPLVETLAGGFASLYLYGSAVEPGFEPARSDLNLLLVARSLPGSELGALAAACRGGRVHGARVNLVVLAADELTRSLDSFALELADIRGRGRLLAGQDVLAPLAVPESSLRTHLERELRILLMRLRRVALWAGSEPAAVAPALVEASGSIAACARGLAYLTGAALPVRTEGVIAAAAAWAGVEPRAWLEAWRLRGERQPPAVGGTLLLEFLDATESFLRRVDAFVTEEK